MDSLRYILTIFLLSAFFFAQAQQSTTDCELPSVQILQDTLNVTGSFDADPGNTELRIRDVVVKPLFESADRLKFKLPLVEPGQAPWTLSDGTGTCEGEIRIIDLSGSIGKANLLRGEKTDLKLMVTGLDGYDEPVPLQIANHTPEIISLEGGNEQSWTINPGDETIRNIQVTGRRPGGFDVRITLLSDENKKEKVDDAVDPEGQDDPKHEKTDSTDSEACGGIYGKVENKLGANLFHIIVFVDGDCNFCPPKKMDTVKISNNCLKYDPSWAIAPAGAVVQVENTADFQCDAAVYLATKFKDRSGLDETLAPGEKATFTAKEYRESPTGIPDDYALIDRFHKHADMVIFVAPSQCYVEVDEEGNYSLGLLYPGTYTLKVYTHPQRCYPPSATVTVRAGEQVRQDFVLSKDNPKPVKE